MRKPIFKFSSSRKVQKSTKSTNKISKSLNYNQITWHRLIWGRKSRIWGPNCDAMFPKYCKYCKFSKNRKFWRQKRSLFWHGSMLSTWHWTWPRKIMFCGFDFGLLGRGQKVFNRTKPVNRPSDLEQKTQF